MTRATAEPPDAGQIETELSMHSGSLKRYRHWTRRFVYTPGIRHLSERAGAYWLIDLIASYCRDPKLAGEEFQLWKLAVHANRSATLSVEDGDEDALVKYTIHTTDFPLAEIRLYLIDGVLLLPSEY